MPSDPLKTALDIKQNQESQSHKWLVQNNVTNNGTVKLNSVVTNKTISCNLG